MNEIQNRWLSVLRKPLEVAVPHWLVRQLLRLIFEYYGFACRSHVCNNEDGRHGNGKIIACPNCRSSVVVLCNGKCYASIDYQGIFSNEADARWVASQPGGAYYELPYNAGLPKEPVLYSKSDAPLSEASAAYRKGVKLPFIAIARDDFDALEAKIETLSRTNGTCTPKAV